MMAKCVNAALSYDARLVPSAALAAAEQPLAHEVDLTVDCVLGFELSGLVLRARIGQLCLLRVVQLMRARRRVRNVPMRQGRKRCVRSRRVRRMMPR